MEEMARIGERFDREVPTDHRQFSPLETRLLLENPDFRAQTIARLNRQQKEVAAVIPGPGTVPGPQVTDKQAGTGTANRGSVGAQASVARLPPWQSGPNQPRLVAAQVHQTAGKEHIAPIPVAGETAGSVEQGGDPGNPGDPGDPCLLYTSPSPRD